MQRAIQLKPRVHSPNTTVKRATRAVARHKCKGPTLLFLLLLVAFPSNGQLGSSKTSLQPSLQGEFASFWTVRDAGLREDFTGTTGYLDILNTSGVPLAGTVFYGEYFDAHGRFCFSLVFSQDQGPVEQTPIPAGEARLIDSVASGLFPSSEPKEVRLYLVRLKELSDEKNSLREWNVPLRAPVTLMAGVDVTVYLGSEATSNERPVVDLLLAKVSVDQEGTVTNVDVLDAASSGEESWFRDFIRRQATFYPATNGGKPQLSQALVLVRAVTESGNIRDSLCLPRVSPWVMSYARTADEAAALPVTNLVLTRPTTKLNKLRSTGSVESTETPPAPQGTFKLSFRDSYWSSPALIWARDPTMPHGIQRVLAAPPPR